MYRTATSDVTTESNSMFNSWEPAPSVLAALSSFDMAVANIDGAVLGGRSGRAAEATIIDLVAVNDTETVIDLVDTADIAHEAPVAPRRRGFLQSLLAA